MHRKILLYGVAAFTMLAQLATPAYMIVNRELTLAKGNVYKFKTAPVDPYNPFSGRYVALDLEADQMKLRNAASFRRNEKVYAKIAVDDKGFAYFSDLGRESFEDADYMRVKIRYAHLNDNEIRLDLPLDRFYMDEFEAPQAERAYWRNSRSEERNAYVSVRVRNGNAVIEDLYIQGKPVREHLKTLKKEK